MTSEVPVADSFAEGQGDSARLRVPAYAYCEGEELDRDGTIVGGVDGATCDSEHGDPPLVRSHLSVWDMEVKPLYLDSLLHHILCMEFLPENHVFQTAPYAHQRKALEVGWSAPVFGYLMEMGTGKTKVAIDNIAALHVAGRIDAAVIVAPKGVYQNWVDKEIPTHMPAGILESASIHLWRGKLSTKKMQEVMTPRKGLHIFVVNVEAFSSGKYSFATVQKFMQMHSCIMVVDESTTIKTPSAERTKAVVKLGRLAKFRRILTGMPITNSPLDIYGQFDFLASGLVGFTNWYSFRARYAVLKPVVFGGRSVQAVVGYRNLDELQKKVADFSFRVTKEDCLDLPAKIYEYRAVEMSATQRRVYDSVLENATAQLSATEHVTATAVITQILRLHQIACGFTVTELGDIHELSDTRTDALMDILAETSGKVIIWASYRHCVSKIVEAIRTKKDPATGQPLFGPSSVVEYHGGVPQDARAAAILRFQGGLAGPGEAQLKMARELGHDVKLGDKVPHDPRCRFFVGTQATGGMGITLTEASTVVYHSNSHSLEHRVQSEDRAHRIGQTRSVTYIDLVCQDTVDSKIIKALRRKIDIASTITGDKYREWLI